jgi:cobalamin biosynthesis protein CobT
MHKLWPHSVKNGQNNSKNATSNATVSDKSKENESSSSSTSNSNNQNEKSSDSDKNNNADALLQSPTENSNLKTPMCLINELVKYNKVSCVHVKFIQVF